MGQCVKPSPFDIRRARAENPRMRERDLSAQLGKVTIAEHREALAQTLSEQEKQRMAASSSAPYAAEPFGNATASPRPTSPRPILVLAASLMAGLLLGTLAALGVARLRAYRATVEPVV